MLLILFLCRNLTTENIEMLAELIAHIDYTFLSEAELQQVSKMVMYSSVFY